MAAPPIVSKGEDKVEFGDNPVLRSAFATFSLSTRLSFTGPFEYVGDGTGCALPEDGFGVVTGDGGVAAENLLGPELSFLQPGSGKLE